MLISHGWDVKCVEWPNNGLARVGQSHPAPGYAPSDCTYGAARIRALPSMQGTRVDMMRLAIKRMRCKPSYRLPMGACLQAHRTTELFRLDICSMTEWVILRRHRKKFTVCLVFLPSPETDTLPANDPRMAPCAPDPRLRWLRSSNPPLGHSLPNSRHTYSSIFNRFIHHRSRRFYPHGITRHILKRGSAFGGLGASTVEGKCADGSIASLEDCLKIERQPVPSCEVPTVSRAIELPLVVVKRASSDERPV